MSPRVWSRIWLLLGIAGIQVAVSSCAALSIPQPAGIAARTPGAMAAQPLSTASGTATIEPTSTQPPTSSPPEPSSTPTVTQSPIAQPPLLTDTPTTNPCWSQGGQIEILQPPEAPTDFRIYLPPCYQEETWQYYPVLYLIHGQSFTDKQWDRLGADEAATRLILNGEIPPFLIVMPHDHRWLQPSESTFETEFLDGLLPWVDAHYRTLPDRKFRAVGGLSRGASWAIHFGLKRWDLFSAIGGHSPPVFWEDVRLVHRWLAAIPAGEMPRIYLDIGEEDTGNIMSSAVWFEQLLTDQEIPHEWHLNDGGHTEKYWSAHVEQYLRWYAQGWR